MSVAETLEPTYTLGERIRRARMDRGWQQEDLARVVGVSRPQVSKWERNKAIPDIIEAVAIAEHTGKSLGWLCGVDTRFRCLSASVQVRALPPMLGELQLFDPDHPDTPDSAVLSLIQS